MHFVTTPPIVAPMNVETHLNNATKFFVEGKQREAFGEIHQAIVLAAGGGPSIHNAREAIRKAFKNDPDFRQTYVSNAACVIMDFYEEHNRACAEDSKISPLSAENRDRLADWLIVRLFEI